MKQTFSLITAFVMFGVIFSVLPLAYSQTSDVNANEQTTLSGDLLNDPLAIKILQKIEESKRKIANLEQQNYDNMQAQKFLEDRRAVALDRLNQSLILWEEEWHEFSPKVAYQKFVDKMPSGVQGIYAKQFEFTEKKHEFGSYMKRIALEKGLSSSQVMDKFNQAASSSLGELGDYNETIQPDSPSEIRIKIANLEGQANDFNHNYFYHHANFNGELSARYAMEVENERTALKDAIKKYHSDVITYEELSEQLTDIREKYSPIKAQILEDNSKSLFEYETRKMNQAQSIIDRINNYDAASVLIEAVWNSETNSIEIIRK
ncbi:hypothetical protein K0U27_11215 [archaeon]|nr:hypothetical protein [archaeon]